MDPPDLGSPSLYAKHPANVDLLCRWILLCILTHPSPVVIRQCPPGGGARRPQRLCRWGRRNCRRGHGGCWVADRIRQHARPRVRRHDQHGKLWVVRLMMRGRRGGGMRLRLLLLLMHCSWRWCNPTKRIRGQPVRHVRKAPHLRYCRRLTVRMDFGPARARPVRGVVMGRVGFLFHPRGACHRVVHCFRKRCVSSEPATMLGVIGPWILLSLGKLRFAWPPRGRFRRLGLEMCLGEGILPPLSHSGAR